MARSVTCHLRRLQCALPDRLLGHVCRCSVCRTHTHNGVTRGGETGRTRSLQQICPGPLVRVATHPGPATRTCSHRIRTLPTTTRQSPYPQGLPDVGVPPVTADGSAMLRMAAYRDTPGGTGPTSDSFAMHCSIRRSVPGGDGPVRHVSSSLVPERRCSTAFEGQLHVCSSALRDPSCTAVDHRWPPITNTNASVLAMIGPVRRPLPIAFRA